MTLIKIIEKMTETEKSWKDAAQKAVKNASKSLYNIRSVWVKDLSAEVENGKVTS